MLVLLIAVALGMADKAFSAASAGPWFDQPWEMTMGMGVDPTVIGLFVLGVVAVEIFRRRLRRKAS
jgi:hypothetical protein